MTTRAWLAMFPASAGMNRCEKVCFYESYADGSCINFTKSGSGRFTMYCLYAPLHISPTHVSSLP